MILKPLPSRFNPELIGLLLFLLLLPFHLVIKKLTPPPWGTYWKEGLLALLLAWWAWRYLAAALRQRQGWPKISPLNLAVLLYLGLLLLRFGLDRSGQVGAWGLYISVMYLPLVWLVPAVLRRHPEWEMRLVTLTVGVGGFIALGGLTEFILDVPLWPSAELIQRQGFPDVFIYGAQVRRVYFTFDSPTALANTLALFLPLALILILLSRRIWARLTAGLAALLIIACIIVTYSRGIWVSAALAIFLMAALICLVQRRRWLVPIGASLVVLMMLSWGLFNLLQPGQAEAASESVIELPPTAYRFAPLTGIDQELLKSTPLHGQAVIETWSLFDPISGQHDTRPVLFERPAANGREEITYQVSVPPAGALRFAIVLSPEVWSTEKGDGASFHVHLAEAGMAIEGQSIFNRYINPKHNPSDRRWRNFLVDLSPWAGQVVNLHFIVKAGPTGDSNFD